MGRAISFLFVLVPVLLLGPSPQPGHVTEWLGKRHRARARVRVRSAGIRRNSTRRCVPNQIGALVVDKP